MSGPGEDVVVSDLPKGRDGLVRWHEGAWHHHENGVWWRLSRAITYRGCPLVNPLCPGDLCQLPPGHEGADKGKHLLGTFPGLEKVSPLMFLTTVDASEREVIDLGRWRAEELWPDHA